MVLVIDDVVGDAAAGRDQESPITTPAMRLG